MKKLLIGIVSLVVCFTLIGCGTANTNISANIDNKMDKLSNTINSLNYASEVDLSLNNSNNDVAQVGLFNYGTPYYSNVNTYGNYYGGMYGMYPVNYNGNLGGMGFNNIGAYNGMGYNGMGYNNFGYNNGLGYNNFGNYANGIGTGFWGSNIDTYRINSVTKDGKTTTTVNTYKQGKPINNYTQTSNATDTQNGTFKNVAITNLNSVCGSCLTSNNYCNQLKNSILSNIDYVKELSSLIRNNKISISNEQTSTINELLEGLLRTTSKINMTKGEFNTELQNVKASKINYISNPTQLNAKYIKLLSCMDTRNAYLQSILNTLLGLENCIDGNCQNNYCWNGTCTNGNCPNGACSNCTDCPTCSTCTDCNNCENCYNCKDCSNCKDCINCENCTDCANLANAKNCTGNNCNSNTNNQNNLNNSQNNSQTQNDFNNSQNSNNNTNNSTQQDYSDFNSPNTSNQTPNTIVGPSIGETPVNNNKNNASINQINDSDDIVRDNLLRDNNNNTNSVLEDLDKEKPTFLDKKRPRPPVANTLPGSFEENTVNNQNSSIAPITNHQTDSFTNLPEPVPTVEYEDKNLSNNKVYEHEPTPVVEENSIFNENEHENNKGLTA